MVQNVIFLVGRCLQYMRLACILCDDPLHLNTTVQYNRAYTCGFVCSSYNPLSCTSIAVPDGPNSCLTTVLTVHVYVLLKA